MKKKINSSMVLPAIICLLPIVLSVILYPQLPDKIPVHFSVSGEADNYLPKAIVCFVFPFAFAILNIFVSFMIKADPKAENSSEKMKNISRWIIPITSLIFVPMSLFISMGKNIPVHIIVPAVVGVLILICGNYLPKSRQNYTIGIKLPWTLNNEENWNKTHRMAGILWIISGIAIILSSFIENVTAPVLLLAVGIMVVVPVIYSYALHRRGL